MSLQISKHLKYPSPSIPLHLPGQCMTALAIANQSGQKLECACMCVCQPDDPVSRPNTCHLCHIYLLMRTHIPTYLTHTNTVSVSAFLYSKGDSSLITLLLSFSIKLSIAGRQCSRRNRDRDRPLSFYLSIDCVSDGCRACPDPQPRRTVSAHYFSVYLSNSLSSDAWSAACLCFPH